MNHCDDPALFAHLEHMIPKILSAVDYSYQAFAFTLFQSENWQKYGFIYINSSLFRTKHLLSSPYLPVRLVVLDILEECTLSLCNFYDEILPMLHQNWPGLLSRLRDREVFVQMRAFQVSMGFKVASPHSSLEAWPVVNEFMISQVKRSKKADSSYSYSSYYSYQKAVLQLLVILSRPLKN
ncbi:unnamed protein product [Enterobius vermicularis]|uniref:MOR2-PAG1_C domain-containing protein n=1 Tax=Enterobius vermicularis TaxID=51028 RepID=A0A0N4V680_ENTVE|nr:unnamed protein product [Enterobius vermicularis]